MCYSLGQFKLFESAFPHISSYFWLSELDKMKQSASEQDKMEQSASRLFDE